MHFQQETHMIYAWNMYIDTFYDAYILSKHIAIQGFCLVITMPADALRVLGHKQA